MSYWKTSSTWLEVSNWRIVVAEAGSREDGRNWGEIDIILASTILGVSSESRKRTATVGSWKRAGRRLLVKVDWHSAVRGVRDLLNSVATKLEEVVIVAAISRREDSSRLDVSIEEIISFLGWRPQSKKRCEIGAIFCL